MKKVFILVCICLLPALVTGCNTNTPQQPTNSGILVSTVPSTNLGTVGTPDPSEVEVITEETSVTLEWRQYYLEFLTTMQEYIAEFDWSVSDDYDPQYPRYTTDFRLADLNFDGVPELIICGESVMASSDIRIYTMSESGIQEVFRGLLYTGSGPILYLNLANDSLFYAFTCLDAFPPYYIDYSFTVYMTDEETMWIGDLADTGGIFAEYTEDYNYDPIFIFNGEYVSEEVYNHLVDNLFADFSELSGYPVSIKDLYPDDYIDNDYLYSADEIMRFFDLYTPEVATRPY